MPSLNSLISTARSSQSAGGERLYKSEAKKIAAHITRDSMVSAAEAKALRGILGDGNLTRSAEKLLKTLELRGDSNERSRYRGLHGHDRQRSRPGNCLSAWRQSIERGRCF